MKYIIPHIGIGASIDPEEAKSICPVCSISSTAGIVFDNRPIVNHSTFPLSRYTILSGSLKSGNGPR